MCTCLHRPSSANSEKLEPQYPEAKLAAESIHNAQYIDASALRTAAAISQGRCPVLIALQGS